MQASQASNQPTTPIYCAISGLPLAATPSYLASRPRLLLTKHPIYSYDWASLEKLLASEKVATDGRPSYESRLLLATAFLVKALGNKLQLAAPLAFSPKQIFLHFDRLISIAYQLHNAKELTLTIPAFSSAAYVTASPKSQPTVYRKELESHATAFLGYLRDEVAPAIELTAINFSTELSATQATNLLAERLSSVVTVGSAAIKENWYFILSEVAESYALPESWIREATRELKEPSSDLFLATLETYLKGLAGSLPDSLISPALYKEAASLVAEARLAVALSKPSLEMFSRYKVEATEFKILPSSAAASQPATTSQANSINGALAKLAAKRQAALAAAASRVEALKAALPSKTN